MAENGVETNAHNACGGAATDTIHGHINDFLVCSGLRCGVSEGIRRQLPRPHRDNYSGLFVI